MNYYKVYFYGKSEPDIMLGHSQETLMKEFKEMFGDNVDRIEPVCENDRVQPEKTVGTRGDNLSILSGYNPFAKITARSEDPFSHGIDKKLLGLTENNISLKIDGQSAEPKKEEEEKSSEGGESKKDGDVKITPDSPDANGDGEVNADDDLNGDGIVDAKDLKIAELQKDLQIRQLEKSIEDVDDPVQDPQQMTANRLRIRQLEGKFVALDHRGETVKQFVYDNKKVMAKSARYEAQRFVEKHYDDQINAKHNATMNQKKEAEAAEDPNNPVTQAAAKNQEAGDKMKGDKDKKKEKAVKEAVEAIIASRDHSLISSLQELTALAAEVSLDEDALVEEILQLSEAGYNDFPRTKAQWEKRLPQYFKDKKDQTQNNLVPVTVKEELEMITTELSLLESRKIDSKTMKTLRAMSKEDALNIIQGLPKNIQGEVRKALGLGKVDGRTKAYKETANRLLKYKEKREISEAKDEKEGEDKKAAGGGDEKAALKALEDAKKTLKSKFGYSDDDLSKGPSTSGAEASDEKGGKKDEKGAGAKDKESGEKSEKPAEAKPESGGDAKPAKPDAGAEGDKAAKEAGGEEEAPEAGAEVPGAEAGEEIPADADADGEADAAGVEAIKATVDQLAADVEALKADDEGEEMAEPEIRPGVGASGENVYDVVHDGKTVANNFKSEGEAQTWIERNKEVLQRPSAEKAADGVTTPGEPGGAVDGSADVDGDGKADANEDPKDIKKEDPKAKGAKPPKPVKESVDAYADFISQDFRKPSSSFFRR